MQPARFFSVPYSATHGGLYCGADGNLRLRATEQTAAADELAAWLRGQPRACRWARLYRAFEPESIPAGLSFRAQADADHDRLRGELSGAVVGVVQLGDEGGYALLPPD